MDDSPVSSTTRDVAALLGSSDLFGGLDESILREFENRLEWLHLSSGETLMREGDPADCFYILISGRLRVTVEQEGNKEVAVGEVGRGEVVGEMAILTDEPRSATVIAIRDSELMMFSRAEFERLLEIHPQAMMRIARQIVVRLRRSIQSQRTVNKEFSLTVLAAGQEAPVSQFIDGLAEALGRLGPTLVLDSNRVDAQLGPGTANTPQHGPNNTRILSWLNELEAKHQYVIYQTDPTSSNWTRRCLRQADRVLAVGRAGSDPGLNKIEEEILRHGSRETFARAHLILLHEDSDKRPSRTQAWLERRHVDSSHHVRLRSDDDFKRLARLLTGRAFGLVLGGGGARALAHVGVIRAIQEAGIPIDAIGGTSMGAIVAANYAMDSNIEKTREICKTSFVDEGSFFDFTFPAVALTAGKRISRLLSANFEETRIEDLWLKFYCVSSNLTRAGETVHHEGPVWKRVRASISLPGIMPPVYHEGDLLVDGGVTNNLPVDVMRSVCGGGTVIAVDVSPKADDTQQAPFGEALSGWRVILNKVNPFTESMDVPSIANVLMRTTLLGSSSRQAAMIQQADLCIAPNLNEFGLLEFGAFEKIEEIGYRHAVEQLKEWPGTGAAAR